MRILSGIFFIYFFVMSLPVYPAVIGYTDEEVKTAATPIVDNILTALSVQDYTLLVKDFSEVLKENTSKEDFLQVSDEIKQVLGDFEAKRFIGFVNKDDYTVVLWKSRYDKVNIELLIKVAIEKNDAGYVVKEFWLE